MNLMQITQIKSRTGAKPSSHFFPETKIVLGLLTSLMILSCSEAKRRDQLADTAIMTRDIDSENTNTKKTDEELLSEGEISPSKAEIPLLVGRGFDELTGQQKEFCLDPESIEVSFTPLNSTESNVEIIHSHAELYKNLNIDINFEASGIYQMFTGSGSLSTRIMKNTTITEDEVKVMAQLLYKKEELQIEHPYAKAQISAPYRSAEPGSDKAMYEFRSQCGDSNRLKFWSL